MKNINFLILFLASLGLFSCSEDTMQDINSNPNNPTNVAARLIITDVINNTSFSVTGSDFALYASVYIEYNVGVWGQMYNAEIRTGEPSSSTTYNNTWNSVYANLLNLKTIIEKCSEGGEEEDNTILLGMAQILSAYNIAMLTDLMGDVPWSEALQPDVIWKPMLDKQADIYNDLNKLLTDGIANLEKPNSIGAIGNQDPLYGGNADSWKKFAYGLKARYAMRLSKVKPDYNAVIEAASKSFTDKGDEAAYQYNGSTVRNPFQRFFTDRDYFGASQSLFDKLISRTDPRDTAFFRSYPPDKVGDKEKEMFFAPNGAPIQIQKYYGISALATSNASAPVYLMSYHELEFLKAEAYARQDNLDKAKEHLENAITICCTNVKIKGEDAKTYYADVIAPMLTSQEETLKEIMLQKYLGLFEIEAIETYNDIRRLKAMGQGDFVPLASTLRFPLRYSYGAEDVTANINVEKAYGDGTYVYTENVWWAGGSR